MIMITINDAATILDISPCRVRALAREGRLPAQKIGRDWLIDEARLKPCPDRRYAINKPDKPG